MTFNFDYIKFNGVPCNQFTLSDLKVFVCDNNTKRLCYSMDGQNNPWGEGKGDVIKWFNAPFANTIKPILEKMTNVSLKIKENKKCCYPCTEEPEIEALTNFIEKYKDIVFLRDYLDMSLALSMHKLNPDDDERTEIGELEYLVKYCDNTDRTNEKKALSEKLQKILEDLPFFKLADCICAIPGSKTFVKEIIDLLEGFKFENISNNVFWGDKQSEIKNAEDGEEKLNLLDKSQFTISEDINLNGKTILLIDDLYKSGLTMQYVALKMKEKGARRVFGISLVKASSNK